MTLGWSPPFSPFILSSMSSAKPSAKASSKPSFSRSTGAPALKKSAAANIAKVQANRGTQGGSIEKPPSSKAIEVKVPENARQTGTFVFSQPSLKADENDQQLCDYLRQIAQGNQQSFSDFYDVTVSRVYSIALRIVRHPEMAEEVVSDVYMQVWRDPTRYDATRGRVLAWLLIISRSRALDALRRQEIGRASCRERVLMPV